MASPVFSNAKEFKADPLLAQPTAADLEQQYQAPDGRPAGALLQVEMEIGHRAVGRQGAGGLFSGLGSVRWPPPKLRF